MKTTFILFFCGFFASAMAQPSLTTVPSYANNQEEVSRVFDYSGSDPAGSAGADKTWDYSTLDYTDVQDSKTVYYTDMSAAPHGEDFPEATWYSVQEDEDGIYENYGHSNSNSYVILGYYVGDRVIRYSDPEMLYSVPFSYNETQNDTYAHSYAMNPSTDWVENGTLSTKFDGYGTLIMPYGTFTDVIRLKLTSNISSVVMFNGAPYSTFDTDYIGYVWLLPGEANPILGITFAKHSQDGGPVTSEATVNVRLSKTVTGLVKNTGANQAFIYPQPATHEATVMAKELQGDCGIKVYNLNGDVVLESRQFADAGKVVLDVQHLLTGIYMLEVNNEDRTYRQKLVVR